MTDDESGAIPDPSSFHAIESMRVLHRQLMRNSHENQDPSTNKRGILQMKLLEVSVFVTWVQGNNVPNISIFSLLFNIPISWQEANYRLSMEDCKEADSNFDAFPCLSPPPLALSRSQFCQNDKERSTQKCIRCSKTIKNRIAMQQMCVSSIAMKESIGPKRIQPHCHGRFVKCASDHHLE